LNLIEINVELNVYKYYNDEYERFYYENVRNFYEYNK